MFPLAALLFRSPPFLGVKVPQQLYSADDSTLLQRPPTIWTPTEGMRLLASRGPQGGTPAPTCAEGSDVGEPTGTAIDGHERQWWGRCWS
jgi:hypothetical protein